MIKIEIIDIFEKVNLIAPIEQRRFFNYFDDSIKELNSQYEGFVFKENKEYSPPSSLNDKNVLLDLYSDAVVDNILFLIGQGESYKSEFIRKARQAYLHYWRSNAKGKVIKRAGW